MGEAGLKGTVRSKYKDLSTKIRRYALLGSGASIGKQQLVVP